MEKREEMILDHLGRYTISLKKVIDELYFDGGSSQTTLGKLVTADLIQSVQNGLSGNFRYYQLTSKERRAPAFHPTGPARKNQKDCPRTSPRSGFPAWAMFEESA